MSFSISFSWKKQNVNGSIISPEFNLKDIPKGTKTFRLKLIDLDLSTYPHGGGVYENDGTDKIPEGALKDGYYGPYPPRGSTHSYQFTIEAMDKEGNVLEVAKVVEKFGN